MSIRNVTQWFKNQELARKLIWINCLLVVVPLVAMGVFTFTSFQGTMEKNVGGYQLQTLKQVTLNIDTYMNELNRLTLMPYQYNEILAYLRSERKPGQPLTLKEIDELNSFVSQVFINGRVDIMGVSLYGERGASYVVLPESQYVTTYKLDESAEWLKQAKGLFGQPIFITTHEVKSTSGMSYEVFSIARELKSFDTGQTLGYIVIDIDPASVRGILTQVNMGNRESLSILDRSGNLVLRKEGYEYPDQPWPLQGEGITQMRENGGDLLIAYFTSKVTGWTTVSTVPVDELMKASDRVRNSIALIGAICIGLAMLTSVFIAFRITKPLRKLSRLMRKVEQGDLQVSFPVANRDEIGRLGYAFNTMVSKLSELGYLLYETEIREKDAQIAALQSKINPHFLYNTLGSISMYAELEGNREIVTMANNLSRLLRYSLSSRKELVTLRDEMEHVKGYMTIQKMRYGERLHFDVDIGAGTMDFAVIPLMIQPIVENAIIHGLDKGIGDGRIRLICREEEAVLSIIVEDDGIGMTETQLDEIRFRLLHDNDLGGKTGNGLLNVHRRIILHFGEPYGLRLESMPFRGLQAILTLPAFRPPQEKLA
ncbi:sensor with HAMP domain [Paenibacillus darwinianus]|uniref:Sensor with HAMP domain n=1 Tax=Paenibacillus darwinianus TaxID=1380763 RepID=A0A9W5S0W8_9BACL|nr:sensor histidine kinase [Paenibacillus darwinianus]EXX88485.1 sensor with HAMP domain [Paenibacillus darwinianus]EXX89267.1 sensor with HAMP domain [Paenibacillus darwinianus]EXX89983.1 sensor with HAMP domain [Paenibacillus darwinianus]